VKERTERTRKRCNHEHRPKLEDDADEVRRTGASRQGRPSSEDLGRRPKPCLPTRKAVVEYQENDGHQEPEADRANDEASYTTVETMVGRRCAPEVV